MNTPLEARSVSLVRDGNSVLDDVSFSVAQGEIFALLGGNGAGKSSTLLTFLGFLQPSAGEVLVNRQSVHADIAAARSAIAYLPESASLYGHMSAYENLEYFLDLAGRTATRSDLDAAFERVALAREARTRRLQHYSKGMRQKTAIALALLRKTPILLLDEATSALDAESEQAVQLALEHVMKGRTTFVITHRLATIRKADRILVFDNARIVQQGTHASLTAQTGLYTRLAELQFTTAAAAE